ncbi:MAG TPA: hypothetical protein VHB20_01430, partial [Verrucomicrobiae bacterium]|nr:hypothetical protein [Verrucomicrobiae bacterium]
MKMTQRQFGFILGSCAWLALAAGARAEFFFQDATINADDTNYDGGDVVVVGCTLTINGPHTFSDMLLTDGGWITHSPATNSQTVGGVRGGTLLTIQNSLVVDAGSGFRADGLSVTSSGGGGTIFTNYPFGASEYYASGGGGGNAGRGGASLGGAPGGNAGLLFPTGPNRLGSSGGAGGGPGGAGGGLIQLTIGDTLILDGSITANGADGTNSGAGGGSGGTIVISAESMAGTGSMAARGGAGELFAGGGGGGGQIEITCQTNTWSGALAAGGGAGATAGGAGIVSVKSAASVYAQVVVDNGGLRGTNTPLIFAQAVSLSVTGGAVGQWSPVNLPLGQAGPLGFSAPFPVGNLLVGSNSAITFTPVSFVVGFNAAGDITIQSGGQVNADGLGVSVKSNGDGNLFVTNGVTMAGGGGYGGVGGGW